MFVICLTFSPLLELYIISFSLLSSRAYFPSSSACLLRYFVSYTIFQILQVLEEIRPYLIGQADGSLELVAIEEPIVKVQITGPAAGVMTVRVAVTQKLREKIPAIAAVQLL